MHFFSYFCFMKPDMEKQLTHNGATMAYTDLGTGPVVIVMHGWGCNRQTIKSITDIATRHHRVLTVDFPGHGQSPDPPELSDGSAWGVEQYTQMIERLVEVEGVTDPILIGHSFGGRVGIMYASRNKVDRLVLVDSAGVKPRRHLCYYYRVYKFKTAKWLALTLLGKERGQKRIDAMRARKGSADYAQASPMMRRVLSRVVNEDLRHVMPAISCPTLLLWGENDTATPLSDAKIMDSLIPDTGLVAFPRCGHYCFLDAPGPFDRVLSSFIDKTPVQ